MLRCLFAIIGAFLFATATHGETITYVRSVSTTNFLGWGQAGFYFPQFAASDVVGPKRTDDNMQFYVANWLEFNFDPWDFDSTTFSPDKPDCFDNCSGRGVYTRGGYSNWDAFILPNGFSGLSGSIVDEQAENNSNNTVNRIRLKTGVPSSFCMHIVTDNTANAHDSAQLILVRGGRPGVGSFDPNAPVPDLSFDGMTDVHTFRFDDFLPDDFIKIRLNSGTPGMDPGFGGLMFDLACDYIPNAQCGNSVCDLTLGESCESCPGDCGACISGPAPSWNGHHHGPDPGSHYVAGPNRLLIFAAHGVDEQNHHVQGVKYGNKNMHFLEARSQDRNDKSTVSVWYLKEADIYSAGGTNFSVDWYHKPGDRSYESLFFTNVSQTFSFGSIDEAGCNDCYEVACDRRNIEPGHISLYTGTHERDGADFQPLNGYSEDADLWMGGNGKATLGHKNGIGARESAGARFGREGAFSLVCLEVQDIPQTDSDGDGVGDAPSRLDGDELAGLNAAGEIFYTRDLASWAQIPGTLTSLVSAGDLNGDSVDDLAGLKADGTVWYTTDLDSWTRIPGRLLTSLVSAGDLNGDGLDDLAGLKDNGVVWYTTDRNSWNPIFGARLSSLVSAGDLNGDSLGDLAGLKDNGVVWHTTDLNSWNPIFGARLSSLVNAGDLNGDGLDDLAGLKDNGVVWYTTDRTSWNPTFGARLSSLVSAGDLNGDGLDDLAGLKANGTIWYTTDRNSWTRIPGMLSVLTSLVSAGDLNGDGNDDLAGLKADGTVWYTTDLATWTQIPGNLSSLVSGNFE